MGKPKRRTKQRDADAEDPPSEKRSKTEVKQDRDEPVSPDQAQAYLRLWKSHRAEWKFKKHLQVKLLKHYFDIAFVPENLFDVFLEYVKGLKGLGRQRTIDAAKKVVAEPQTATSDSSDSDDSADEKAATGSEGKVANGEDESDGEGDEEGESEEEKKKQAALLLKHEEERKKQAAALKRRRAKQLLELLETA